MRPTSATKRLALVATLCVALLPAGCGGDDGATCGPGTHLEGGVCVSDAIGSGREPRGRDAGGTPGDGVDGGGDDATTDVRAPDDDASSAVDSGADASADGDEADRDAGADDAEPTPDASEGDGGSDETCGTDTTVVGSWAGTWDGTIWGSHVLVGGDFIYTSDGDLSFEIVCRDAKFLIDGEMSGIAEGLYPFESDLAGEFDPETGEIEMEMVDAFVHITYAGVEIDVFFEATLTGPVIDGPRVDRGRWSGRSTFPEGAEGGGNWRAVRGD